MSCEITVVFEEHCERRRSGDEALVGYEEVEEACVSSGQGMMTGK